MSATRAVLRSTCAEWGRLVHVRTLAPALAVASVAAGLLTWVVLDSAEGQPPTRSTSTANLSLASGLAEPGSLATSYLFVLVIAVFAVMSASGYSRGTTRAALLRQPGRLALAEAVGRLAAFTAGWALFGSLLGVLTRSVVAALAIGLLWAGPFENIVGDELAVGPRWFPGLLLRAVLLPGSSDLDRSRLWLTLGCYALAAVLVCAWTVRRRDVTA